MMRITVLAVGKLTERFWRDACAEYEKRLSRYCTFRVIEVTDERAPERASEAEREKILQVEGTRLLAAMEERAPLWVLDVQGMRMDSERFAETMREAGVQGTSHLQFAIGGSLGVSQAVLSRAERRVSFSDMTFPHQLARVILMEQIYRGFRIIRGEPYHK